MSHDHRSHLNSPSRPTTFLTPFTPAHTSRLAQENAALKAEVEELRASPTPTRFQFLELLFCNVSSRCGQEGRACSFGTRQGDMMRAAELAGWAQRHAILLHFARFCHAILLHFKRFCFHVLRSRELVTIVMHRKLISFGGRCLRTSVQD